MSMRKAIRNELDRPAPPAGPAALTLREVEVAAYLGMDSTPAAIAQALGIRRETVRIHMKNIYLKLGVHSRHAAVVVLVQAGMRVTRQDNCNKR